MLTISQRLSIIFGGMMLLIMLISVTGWLLADRLSSAHHRTLVNAIPLALSANHFNEEVRKLTHQVVELQYVRSENDRWEHLFNINETEEQVIRLHRKLFLEVPDTIRPLRERLSELLRQIRLASML